MGCVVFVLGSVEAQIKGGFWHTDKRGVGNPNRGSRVHVSTRALNFASILFPHGSG